MNVVEHRTKAERNERLIAELKTAGIEYKEWSIVIAYYAMIHYVMNYLHKHVPGYDDETNSPPVQGKNLKWHTHRRMLVAEYLPTLHADYEYLEAMAREARYLNLDMAYVTGPKLAELERIVASEFRPLN